jgi:hypothetical protein
MAGGDARGDGEEDPEGQALGRGAQGLHAGQTGNVGDLVGIGDDGAGPVRDDGAGELREPGEGAFGVDVSVNERRSDPCAACINALQPLGIVADAGDDAVGNGDVRWIGVPREDIDDGSPGQDQVAWFVALSHAQAPPPPGCIERHFRIRHGPPLRLIRVQDWRSIRPAPAAI